jgi:hypothetical protein
MKNLFEPSSVNEIKKKIERPQFRQRKQVGPEMTVAQMMAHCSAWMEMAAGLKFPPRSMWGGVFGCFAKTAMVGEEPLRCNTFSEKGLIVKYERRFAEEQPCLLGWIDHFAAESPKQCTKHPHSFLGHLTPGDWAILGYKHLDHHVRRFEV